ncbi:MAG: hypothetical protein ACRCZI_11990 [Cetobacterium sp.]
MKSLVIMVALSISVTGCAAMKPVIDSVVEQMCSLDAVKKMSEEYTKHCPKAEAPVSAPVEVPSEK